MPLFNILKGDCANEVETEQIVADADVSSLTSSSSKLGLVELIIKCIHKHKHMDLFFF